MRETFLLNISFYGFDGRLLYIAINSFSIVRNRMKMGLLPFIVNTCIYRVTLWKRTTFNIFFHLMTPWKFAGTFQFRCQGRICWCLTDYHLISRCYIGVLWGIVKNISTICFFCKLFLIILPAMKQYVTTKIVKTHLDTKKNWFSFLYLCW